MKTLDLRQPGDPGLYHIPEFVTLHFEREPITIDDHMRTGPYDAHRSQQTVKKLRKFIQVIFSEHPSQPGDPVVILQRWPEIRLPVQDHRSQFITGKRLPPPARPSLQKKYRAFRIQFDQQGQHGQQPTQHKYNKKRRNDDVKRPFKEKITFFVVYIGPERYFLFKSRHLSQDIGNVLYVQIHAILFIAASQENAPGQGRVARKPPFNLKATIPFKSSFLYSCN
jgi:hypothetical protein